MSWIRHRYSGLLAAGVQFLLVLGWGMAGYGGMIPRRIVSLGPIHTENIYLLGAGDRLVANTT